MCVKHSQVALRTRRVLCSALLGSALLLDGRQRFTHHPSALSPSCQEHPEDQRDDASIVLL